MGPPCSHHTRQWSTVLYALVVWYHVWYASDVNRMMDTSKTFDLIYRVSMDMTTCPCGYYFFIVVHTTSSYLCILLFHICAYYLFILQAARPRDPHPCDVNIPQQCATFRVLPGSYKCTPTPRVHAYEHATCACIRTCYV